MKNYHYTFFKFLIFCLFPCLVLAEDDIDIPGQGEDPAQAPISDYWWVLVLVVLLYVWKQFQQLQSHRLPKEE